jgi:cytidylate kinase
MIITIDGPAASGKSTIAHMLAQQLQIWYLNSGILYRGLAYQLINHYRIHVEALEKLDNTFIGKAIAHLSYEYDVSTARVTLRALGTDITPFLKSAAMDRASSLLAQNPYARYGLSDLQRTLVNDHSCVVEGRDTGSHTFTEAFLKVFVTASLAVRAHRWLEQQRSLGYPLGLEEARLALLERDKRDSEREYAPLQIPHGAFILDTSNLTPLQGVELIREEIGKKIEAEKTKKTKKKR